MKFESLPKFSVLIGPAGTGKTRFLLENFTRLLEENQSPLAEDLLYILPTAEHRERITDLILRKERAGFFGTRVTTLSRFMQNVLKTVSPGQEERGFASGAERRFLLAEILRTKGGSYFSAVREFPGFVERMAALVGELKESLVPLGAFRQSVRALVKARPEIREKYEGLLEIYEAYEERTASLGLRDLGDALRELQKPESRPSHSGPRLARRSSRFRHLFLDGFFDFSKAQLEFIRWLKGQSERITLTLTAELSPDRRSLFTIPLATLEELERIGFKPVDFFEKKNHRAAFDALAHVEKNLFRPGAPAFRHCEPRLAGRSNDTSLKILEATGTRGEVEMIAREVRRLVRSGPFHYSDMAVILRRIGDYAGMFQTVFREFKIPVEIHERERLRAVPLARTLASFFKILQNDWLREDLFNFLKSSYLGNDYAEICGLEMRGLDLGISSGRDRWLKEIGGPIFEKISGFQDRFLAARTLEELIRLTGEALSAFGLTRIPFTYEESVRRDFASLKRIRSLFDEIRRSHSSGNGSRGTISSKNRGGSAMECGGHCALTFELFAREFLGLIEVDLFSLHERDKNAVQVYDISLARQKEYKVVFLAGLLERVFPAETREDPILSDEERRTAGLGERLPRQALERYFFYLAVTRAREGIIFSYPRFDLEGHEALPSFYVDEVTRLFPGPLPKISYSVSQSLPRLEDVVEERELEAHVIQRLFRRGRPSEKRERLLALSLYNRLLERPSFQALLPKVLFDPVARIDSEAVRAAFLPKGAVFTPTRLEAYGRCPYRYFAGHLLELEEQEEGIDARQVGILLHQVLEDYWKERVEKKNQELGAVGPAKDFVKRRLRELLKEDPLSGERRFRIELKTAQMEEWLAHLVEKEILEGSPVEPFRPAHLEFKFGFSGRGAEALELYDPHRENLKLRGKIDRIDVDPSGKAAVVIDYKTGGTFKARDLGFGTALQLPLYLLAVEKLLKLRPAAGLIYKISDAEKGGFYSEKVLEEAGAPVRRSRNVLDPKEFHAILERAVRFSHFFSEGIRRAEIPVRPRDCDDHCPFPSLCRIEKWRLPFIYQDLREEDKKRGTV